MKAEEKQQLAQDVISEMHRWGSRPVLWQMDISTAVSTCGCLQVALRHPDFARSPSANQARQFIMNFRDCIPDDFPALKRVIDLGFHSRFDEERKHSTEEQFRVLLRSALGGLRSYQFGNSSPELAEEIADRIENVIGQQ
jgi:hypothetical protein